LESETAGVCGGARFPARVYGQSPHWEFGNEAPRSWSINAWLMRVKAFS